MDRRRFGGAEVEHEIAERADVPHPTQIRTDEYRFGDRVRMSRQLRARLDRGSRIAARRVFRRFDEAADEHRRRRVGDQANAPVRRATAEKKAAAEGKHHAFGAVIRAEGRLAFNVERRIGDGDAFGRADHVGGHLDPDLQGQRRRENARMAKKWPKKAYPSSGSSSGNDTPMPMAKRGMYQGWVVFFFFWAGGVTCFRPSPRMSPLSVVVPDGWVDCQEGGMSVSSAKS